MSVSFSCSHLRVPQGFGAILECLAREVLRDQPEDIPAFAADYFSALLKAREESGEDPAAWAARLEDRFNNKYTFKGSLNEDATTFKTQLEEKPRAAEEAPEPEDTQLPETSRVSPVRPEQEQEAQNSTPQGQGPAAPSTAYGAETAAVSAAAFGAETAAATNTVYGAETAAVYSTAYGAETAAVCSTAYGAETAAVYSTAYGAETAAVSTAAGGGESALTPDSVNGGMAAAVSSAGDLVKAAAVPDAVDTVEAEALSDGLEEGRGVPEVDVYTEERGGGSAEETMARTAEGGESEGVGEAGGGSDGEGVEESTHTEPEICRSELEASTAVSISGLANIDVCAEELGGLQMNQEPICHGSIDEYSSVEASGSQLEEKEGPKCQEPLETPADLPNSRADSSEHSLTGDGDKHGSEVTAEGHGSEVTADGHGSEVTAEGHGSEVTAEVHGSEVTADGHGREVIAEGHGSEVTAEGHGSEVTPVEQTCVEGQHEEPAEAGSSGVTQTERAETEAAVSGGGPPDGEGGGGPPDGEGGGGPSDGEGGGGSPAGTEGDASCGDGERGGAEDTREETVGSRSDSETATDKPAEDIGGQRFVEKSVGDVSTTEAEDRGENQEETGDMSNTEEEEEDDECDTPQVTAYLGGHTLIPHQMEESSATHIRSEVTGHEEVSGVTDEQPVSSKEKCPQSEEENPYQQAREEEKEGKGWESDEDATKEAQEEVQGPKAEQSVHRGDSDSESNGDAEEEVQREVQGSQEKHRGDSVDSENLSDQPAKEARTTNPEADQLDQNTTGPEPELNQSPPQAEARLGDSQEEEDQEMMSAEIKGDPKEECGQPQDEEDIMDIPLDDPEANRAAAKIQAGFRGHMTRKKMKDDKPEEVSSSGEALNGNQGNAGATEGTEAEDTSVPEQ